MATYIILNIVFLAVVLVLLRVKLHRPSKAWYVTLWSLLILTAVFDSIIVALHIVDYDPEKILGILIGYAPVEDFFYAILAAVVVPILWNRLRLTKKEKQ